MKRAIKSNKILKIYVDIYDAEIQVAASSELEEFKELQHPSVKKKYKQSDEWLKHVNDLTRSIIGSMHGRHFKNIKGWPSKKSYTYYISFQPTDINGDAWDTELTFQIELRDHTSSTHEDLGEVTKNLVVKTYYLNGKTYRGMMDICKEIWGILDELQNGNFESFYSL